MKTTLFAAAMCVFASASSFAEVSIITHPSNTSSLSQKDIERIYLGKENQFPNGKAVEAANLKDGALKDAFNSDLLNRSSAQIGAYWSKLIFTGKGIPPTELETEADVVAFVASNENAIGYVDSSAVTPEVKVILSL